MERRAELDTRLAAECRRSGVVGSLWEKGTRRGVRAGGAKVVRAQLARTIVEEARRGFVRRANGLELMASEKGTRLRPLKVVWLCERPTQLEGRPAKVDRDAQQDCSIQ